MTTIQMIIIVCPLVFFAAFIDAIAGGGGLISLPAYLFTGMPTHLAYGSNKFSGCMGSFFSSYRFLKSGVVHLKVAIISAFFALIGSYLGAQLVLILSDYFLKISMTILLPIIAVILLFKKNKQEDVNVVNLLSKRKTIFLSSIIGFLIGAYDGFFGPGTGTFLILGYTTFMGFDYRTACGNARIVNLASNFAALIAYVFAGKVMYVVAIPAAFCSITGYWLGSGLAIKKGSKYIKPLMVCVMMVLFLKIIIDLLG
ncbi:sulfite exporter TauE/SafE family protein [Tannockella kyphosi]|uniref:sulfite exporter TauE/SafE family protein n=1 Tax=Tannockella kyphosi TaxID=2899121 RepID=UPI002012659A|nr:TSUP family transporter [Tannockella kyphosi]